MLNTEISMNSLFPAFFENNRDGMIIFDHSYMIIDVNSGVETISGFGKGEMVGRNLAEFLTHEDMELLQFQLNPFEDLKPGEVHLVHLLHKSGSRKIVESSEMFISQRDNTVILSTIRDVTQLHETRMELEKQKHYSESILNSLPCIYYIVEIGSDEIPRLNQWNENFQAESKMSPDELQGKNILEFFDDHERDIIEKEIGHFLKGEKSFYANVFTATLGDGSREKYYYQAVAFESEGKQMYLGTGLSVNGNRNLERILIESVIRAEESERRRISSDLHDGLGAELSTIKLYIQGLLDSNDKEYQKNIGQKLIQLVDDAVDSLSDIAFNISPHILLEYGLVAAIEAFITRLNAQDKTKVDLEFDEIERFDLNKEITLYRTITELINNTLKHAGAECIHLELREVNGKVIIIYSDNGCGFDVANMKDKTPGMGIRNMRSRIESFKGNFDITARRDSGMIARITLSVSEKDE